MNQSNMESPTRPLVRGRYKFRDNMMTYDAGGAGGWRTVDADGNQIGRPLGMACRAADYSFRDSMGNTQVVRNRVYDSTGAFFVGELERMDMTLHEPLAAVSWGRDIDLREDVTIADEVSSFTISTYASGSSLGSGNATTGTTVGIGNGKAWIGKTSDQIAGVGLDIGRVPHPLRLWGLEIKYSIPELESAAKVGRPIDQQKYDALQLKHQMDIDEQVYIGDTAMNDTGLVNNSLVTQVGPVVNGVAGQPQWQPGVGYIGKTPDEILADVNTAITTVWANSAWAVMPSRILLPPAQYGFISTAKVSNAGNISILKYLEENSIVTAQGRGKLQIYPLKWCIGAGASGTIGTLGTTDRMVVYTKEKNRIRYPMTLLARTPVQYDSIYHKSTYYCRLGVMEVVYPDTVGYFDGI